MALSAWLAKNDFGDMEATKMAELGLESPNDLAFAFLTEDQARTAGLGAPWAVARLGSRACAISSGIEVHEAVASFGAAKLVSSRVKGVIYLARAQWKVRSRHNKHASSPMQDAKARTAVAKDLVQLALEWLKPEDEEDVTEHVSQYERVVLRRRQLDWARWVAFCGRHSISPIRAAARDVRQCLGMCLKSATAGGLWDSLRWFQVQMRLPIDLPSRPRRAATNGVHTQPKQAVALEPEVVVRLERYIETRKGAPDELLGAALAAWICACSSLRFTHLQRARLVSRSRSTVRIHVYRGKRRSQGVREGYYVRVPRQALACGCPVDLLWDL